jgi:hypothetical protein
MWVMWNVYLKIVLVLVQVSCTICAKHTIGSKIILGAPDGTIGSKNHLVVSHFGPFRDSVSVSVSAGLVHNMRQTYHRLRNHCGYPRWYS